MRPRHDVAHPEADPAETIHFLRNSNDQWQATAERVARQRDDAQDIVKRIDTVVRDSELLAPEIVTAIQDVLDDAS